MKKFFGPIIALTLFVFGVMAFMFIMLKLTNKENVGNKFAGSQSCRECHEEFYTLWETSHHGKAMQPVDSAFITRLVQHVHPVKVGEFSYQVVVSNDSLFYNELLNDGSIHRTLPVSWALGGKNVVYFLTPWEKGRLQTLPLAYDLNRNEWYDNPRSGIRDFVEPGMQDSALIWTHALYTFNTTCHSCHVSQLERNYNSETDTYHTTWNEPGINCETCHGPSQEHNDVCRAAARKGKVPDDLKIISTKHFTPDQHNSSCASCHAKMIPLTDKYLPGETFYDHFNLVTLENPDYYPDGRDLGENYTHTTWIQSKCIQETGLHCVTCHTSSGRYRFRGELANNACASCHADNVKNFEAHSHHKPESGLECVSCHMPKTEFARMIRSDHSMRPPMPAATIAFGSPNACNNCHTDKTPQWANQHVTAWKGSDFQKETLYYGKLIQEGRTGNFTRIPQMVQMIAEDKPNELFVASIIRILAGQQSAGLKEALLKAVNNHPSPLVRSAAAETLAGFRDVQVRKALLNAVADSLRAVRIAAGSSLAAFSTDGLTADELAIRNNAIAEYKTSLTVRPDTWTSHFNLGNLQAMLGETQPAIASFQRASFFEPEVIGPYINVSMLHSQTGDNTKAEEAIVKALEIEPRNPVANTNYGLLMGERGRYDEAIKAYQKVLDADQNSVTAAYNLAVIFGSRKQYDEAIRYATMTKKLQSDNPRNAYTLAYYLNESGKPARAIDELKTLLQQFPVYFDGYQYLESILLAQKKPQEMIAVLEKAMANSAVDPTSRDAMKQRIQQLKTIQIP
jgi:tetratricopeptide (TPR) repeat protein